MPAARGGRWGRFPERRARQLQRQMQVRGWGDLRVPAPARPTTPPPPAQGLER